MAERSEFKAEGIAGLAVGLIAAAMAALGVPRLVWVVVLVIGVILLGVAAIRWSHRDDLPVARDPDSGRPPDARRRRGSQ